VTQSEEDDVRGEEILILVTRKAASQKQEAKGEVGWTFSFLRGQHLKEEVWGGLNSTVRQISCEGLIGGCSLVKYPCKPRFQKGLNFYSSFDKDRESWLGSRRSGEHLKLWGEWGEIGAIIVLGETMARRILKKY